MRTAGWLAALITVAAATTYAQCPMGYGQGAQGGPGGMGRRGGKHDRPGPGIENWIVRHEALAREAGVSDKQIDALKELGFKTEHALITLRGDLDLAQLELRKVLESDKVAQDALDQAIEAVGRAQTALRKVELSARVQVRELVGADTLAKLREKVREEFKNRGPRGRRGPQREMQPCPMAQPDPLAGPPAHDEPDVEPED